MTLFSASADLIEEVARALCPEPVTRVSELGRGGNSRLFGVETRNNRYALKKYPANDDRNRLGAEVAALEFFARMGIGRTPRIVATAPGLRVALLSWVDGEPVGEVRDADVEQFAAFQVAIDAALDERARAEIGEASEACLSGSRILAHIERRYARLEAVKHEVAGFAEFFDSTMVPSLHRFADEAREAYRELGLDFAEDLKVRFRTLIPSDFGAHNALRGEDGSLWFLDFEYFGWDDPLTSIANFVLHPGMTLSQRQRLAYQEALLSHFGDHAPARRLEALMPLYCLRWCAIILGELLPERWQHRQASGAAADSWDEVRRRQIVKARALMSRLAAG